MQTSRWYTVNGNVTFTDRCKNLDLIGCSGWKPEQSRNEEGAIVTDIKPKMRPRYFAALSLIIGIITALFAIFYGYQVFYRSISFSDYKYLGAISDLAFILVFSGIVLGVIGLRSPAKGKAIAGIILCILMVLPLAIIDLNFFPGVALF